MSADRLESAEEGTKALKAEIAELRAVILSHLDRCPAATPGERQAVKR